ncbi:hypothetical protein C2G38_2298824 [Gigaspora rosea]|uniref:Uncharacterized protein n=1 Tax=Gigaspora rosea TaxID=44941 RepID=A0A397VGU5_9GLOM|nr:hypothetical protein C2G38_2298824 [Gigaspora rosea]
MSNDYSKTGFLPSKSQFLKILKRFIDDDDMKESQSYDGSLVKWEVNKHERVIKAFLKSDSSVNCWKSIDNIRLNSSIKLQTRFTGDSISLDIHGCSLFHNDLVMITSDCLFVWSILQKGKIRLRYYTDITDVRSWDATRKKLQKYIEKIKKYEKNSLPVPRLGLFMINREESFTEDGRKLFEEILDDYIDDKILMKLYGKEILKDCLKIKNYSMLRRICNKIYNEPENSFLLRIQLLDIFTFLFAELTQFPQILKEFLLYTLFIHSNHKVMEIKFNKFFSEPHLQSHIKYLQPYINSNIKLKTRQFFIENFPIFFDILEKMEKIIEKIFYKKTFQAVIFHYQSLVLMITIIILGEK